MLHLDLESKFTTEQSTLNGNGPYDSRHPETLVDFIREIKCTGVQFIKVADFEEGMQNHESFDGITTY